MMVLMMCLAGPPCVDAQLPIRQILVPSSINPVGSGARAIGMGGAFIGVADDATAASWNPGGLIQLERPEVSIVGTWFQRTEDVDSSNHPEASGEQTVSGNDLNYLSAAYPFNLFHRNMIVSLNYQNLYDFTRHWEFPVSYRDPMLTTTQQVESNQEGSFAALGLAYGLQISPTVSAGLTLNFWDDWLGSGEWQHDITISGSGTYNGIPFESYYHREDHYTIDGVNVNLGVLWNITAKWNFGAVVKTPFEADLKHQTQEQAETPPGLIPDVPIPEYQNLNMPLSYGIGLAYRFSDHLTGSLDMYRTEWEDFYFTDTAGQKISPITGKPEGESNVDPTHQVRAGLEYLHLKNQFIIPVRGGVFYDPAPAEGSPDQFFGFSLGSGIARGRVVFDLAYQFRFGNDVRSKRDVMTMGPLPGCIGALLIRDTPDVRYLIQIKKIRDGELLIFHKITSKLSCCS
jgi:long-subunit fatty acid transport protein